MRDSAYHHEERAKPRYAGRRDPHYVEKRLVDSSIRLLGAINHRLPLVRVQHHEYGKAAQEIYRNEPLLSVGKYRLGIYKGVNIRHYLGEWSEGLLRFIRFLTTCLAIWHF